LRKSNFDQALADTKSFSRQQMILKWARFGPDEEIAITEDFSNLTLDTIALCTMDYRFNSLYVATPPTFY
jgi:hypothetical protein